MVSDVLNQTFLLFSLVILADGKIRPEETTVMGHQLADIQRSLRVEDVVTADQAEQWFLDNMTGLKQALAQGRGRQTMECALEALSHLSSAVRLRLYDALIRIAYSDAEYHATEQSIVERAAIIWRLDRPKL